MKTRCITPYCHNSDIVHPLHTRTPGFYPDYECRTCGARWIDRGQGLWSGKATLAELDSAMREYRSTSGGEATIKGTKSGRAGRREV
jgi:hypothetical protein